jgi:hypothetical protein
MHSKPVIMALVLVAGWLGAGRWALGIVVFERGKAQPTIGRLVRQDERSVVIELEQPGGKRITREILRSEIEELVNVVCDARLEALRPENPEAYRDYAEELAAKRKDPDARLTSLRLYLIAASLAPETLGHSCLLGMVALARDPPEQRRFRAMAFLLDPHHDRSVLVPAVEQGSEAGEAGRSGLLQAVQAMRRGQRRVALQWVEREPVRNEFEKYEDLISLEQFRNLRDEIPPPVLSRLLTLEWILSREHHPDDSPWIDRETSWSQIAQRRELEPVPRLTLESLTEFDPRDCIYVQGRWVRPE